MGELWLTAYESETIKDDVEQLWQTLKPLYQNIHAYVRAKLRNVYGDQFSDDGLIPAHLLGITNYISVTNKISFHSLIKFL
jgi:peptidyl-dipeptidase A